jgi:xylulokinase
LNEEGDVIRDSIIWCDQRTIQEPEELTRKIGHQSLYELSGNIAQGAFTASKLLWIKTHEPDCFAKIHQILLPKDYIVFKLTGRFSQDVSDASGTQLLDIAQRKWSDTLGEGVGLRLDQLPPVYESETIIGHILPQVASELGLSRRTIVIAGAGDQAAAALGNGIIEDELMSVNLGSSGVMFMSSKTPMSDPKGRVQSFCHALPDLWHTMGVTQGAGISLAWFKDSFYMDDQNRLMQLNAEFQKIPPGSDGLIFLPYLRGERSPLLDPYARGVFFGIQPHHTRGHFARAVLEGVSYSFCDCLHVYLEQGIIPKEVRLSGGGAKSNLWADIIATTLNHELILMEDSEAGTRGMAMLAAYASGKFSSITEAVTTFVRPMKRVVPSKDLVAVYRKGFLLYQEIYQALKPSFRDLDTFLKG